MKHFQSGALALTATLVLTTAAPAQTIKLGTVAPDGSPWHKITRHMADQWTALTDGNVQTRVYSGGIARDDPDMVRKMRVGQLHAAMLTGQGLTQIAPEIQALHMPMLLFSYGELDFVRERLASEFEERFERRGFKILNWGEAGWVYFFTQQPVVSPEDLKGQRLFVWSSDSAFIEAWKDAGYNPVPLAVPEMLAGLQSGVITAFVAPPIAALSFQWFGLAKHMTDLKWSPLVGATVMSMKAWRTLPEDKRPALLRAAHEASARFKPEVRKLNEDSIEMMKKYGLEVHPVPPAAVAQWERGARAGYPKLVGRVVSAEMIQKVERLRDEYRRTHGTK